MATTESHSLVLVSKANGYVIIPAATPLTRLNYFDGKFLRASDLKAEQDYLRQLVALSNQAGGAGVAHGFDLTQGASDTIEIGAGLAIDPTGRVLLLPRGTSVNVQELIDKSRALSQIFGKSKVLRAGEFEECELDSAPPAVDNASPNNLYVIVISPADALCGEEDVYGKLCEEACATSTDRPYAVEGLMVRAVPLVLRTPLPSPKVIALTQTHLRSRVASAYFEDERRRVANLISKAGLEQETWCLGADAAAGSGVPIGVIARSGATTVFLDAWIARRERIDTPAKRYWQWRMMMRPWDVFLAQVLQFQCQLHDLFEKVRTPGGEVDPCGGARGVISEAASTIAELKEFYTSTAQRLTRMNVNLDEAITFKGGLTRLTTLNDKLVKVQEGLSTFAKDRLLIIGGIVELPSAGYLPVVPGAASTINQQVRRLLGEGVDLRFCVVRPDYVAHALEEAQHMERISLLQGLDDPENKPEVDILVPNGEVLEQKLLSPGSGFEASVDLNLALLSPPSNAEPNVRTMNFRGAARAEKGATGGGAFYLSGENQVKLYTQYTAAAVAQPVAVTQPAAGKSATAAATATQASSSSTAPFADRAVIGDAVRVTTSGGYGELIQYQPPRSGFWLDLRCDRNIFTLSRGDSANFNSRAIVASSNARTPLLDVQLNGVFQVTQPSRTSGTVQKLSGHIENASLSFSGAAFGATGARSNVLVDLDVIATLTGNSAIEVILVSSRFEIVLSANWGKNPLEISADIIERFSFKNAGTIKEDAAVIDAATARAEASKVGATTGAAATAAAANQVAISRTGVTLAHADLKENADVLSDKDSRHIQALAALELIAKALNDSNFADAKARLLFPAPPKPTDELLVRGTMDWVLFHRRRTKRCSAEICVPPVSPARQYQVYHLAIGSLEERDAVRKKLIEGKLPEDSFNKLPFVDFDGGLASLATDPQAWRSDWANIQPGNSIVYAAIANRDSAAADGDTLALTRLDRLVDAVAPVSTPNSQMQSELLDQVPITVPASSVDGVIFLFTIKAADLQLTKSPSHSEVRTGDTVDYTITLVNKGPEAAQAVVLTDPIPVNLLSFTSLGPLPAGWTTTSTPPPGGSGNIVFSKGSIASSETATFHVIATVVANTAETMPPIQNTATVTSSTTDPDAADNSATATVHPIPPPRANLAISKSVSPAQYGPGGADTLTYQLVVRNIGPDAAQGVEVRDVLPAGTTLVPATPPTGWTMIGPGTDRTLIFRKTTQMVSGETATIQIQVRVSAPLPASITNAATVQSSTTDPDPSNNRSADAVATLFQPPPPPRANLEITKSVTPAQYGSEGGNLNYVLVVRNIGPDAAQNVVVKDVLPAVTSFIEALAPGWNTTGPAADRTLLFSKNSMALGETATIQIQVRVEPIPSAGLPASVTNTATVESSTTDPVLGNNSDDAVATRSAPPNVIRTGLVVFTQIQTFGRVVLQGSRTTSVRFTNNVPDAATLNTALGGFPPGSSLGRFRRITLEGANVALDAQANVDARIESVAAAMRAAGGTVLGTSSAPLLSSSDRTGLANASVNLTGIDEVIYLEMG